MYTRETEYVSRPDFISPSNIKGVKTLRQFYHNKYVETTKKFTPAQQRNMDIGKALHCLMLEPTEFDKRFTLEKGDERTVLKPEDYNMVFAMKDAATTMIPDFDKFIPQTDDALIETTFYCLYTFSPHGVVQDITSVDKETTRKDIKPNQLLVRNIPDYVRRDGCYIVELKTTIDASTDGFVWEASKMGYDIQGAMAVDTVQAVLGGEYDFFFLAFDKNEPYDVMIHQMDTEWLGAARRYYHNFLFAICNAFQSGNWRGYNTGDSRVHIITPPPSRLYKLYNTEFN